MTLGPLIVQSDHTVLIEVAHPEAEEAKYSLKESLARRV